MTRRILRDLALAAAALTGLAASAQAGTITETFTYGAGTQSWTDAGNWSAGIVPNNGAGGNNYDAAISNANVSIGVANSPANNIAVNSVTLNSSALLLNNNGNSLTAGQLSGTGSVSVSANGSLTLGTAANFTGSIGIAPGALGTSLRLGDGAVLNAAVTISGGSGVAQIGGIAGTETVTNLGSITAATGSIGNLAQVVNLGTIAASNNGHFQIASYRFNNDSGTIGVGSGAQLQLSSPHFDNYDGVTLTGGTYDVNGTLVLGGQFNNIGGGTSVTVGAGGNITNGVNSILPNLVSNDGTLTVQNKAFALTGGAFTNAGVLYLQNGAALSVHGFNNYGSTSVDAASRLTGTGLYNGGALMVDSTADFRGATNSFVNLSAATETLNGGTYVVGPNGTLLYSGGSGVHGGDIVSIGAGTGLTLNRGGQIQTGVSQFDALAQLTNNAGTLQLLGGNHSFLPTTGTFTNQAGGSVQINNASARVYGGILNQGSFNTTGGTLAADSLVNQSSFTAGLVQFFGDVDNQSAGTLTVSNSLQAQNVTNEGLVQIGSASLQAAGTYTQSAGSTALTGGTLQTAGLTLAGGDLTGNGQIAGDVDNSGGDVVVRGGGNLDVTGSFTQEAGGTLTETLGAGDFLSLTGDAHLDGLFDGLDGKNGVYQLGDTFKILHFDGSLFGNFTAFDLPPVSGVSFQEVIGAHDISLVVVGNTGTTATPEPTFFWLGGAMISGVVLMRRRRA